MTGAGAGPAGDLSGDVASPVLRVGTVVDAVPQARRFAREALAGIDTDLLADAELVVTELVTNALLHAAGAGDVLLRVCRVGATVRLEVEDGGHSLPLLGRLSTEAMTGRGIRLVATLATAWGVDPAGPGRKVVWAELAGDDGATRALDETDLDVDAFLAAWADDDEVVAPGGRAQRHTVRLGAVSTELLLAAKAHVDNLVREFTLATAGAAAGAAADVPAHLARLIPGVVESWAEARQSIKEQALAAAHRGDAQTELVLTLPATAADAGEDYLAALDEVDRYAAAARLLTLSTPPVHRVFRRWYVQALVDQLRARSAGRDPGAPVTFPERLAEEVAELSALRATARRTAGLHEVGAALAGLTTPADVAAAVVRVGVDVLGAHAAGLAVSDGGRLTVLATHGFPSDYVQALEASDPDSDELPGPVVLRTGEALWIESSETRDAAFPRLAEMEPQVLATCLVPLVAGRRLGVLRFSFTRPRLFDEGERGFVRALADQAALALQRSELFLAERAARQEAELLAQRLDLLMTITADLARAQSIEEILERVVSDATRLLGARSARVHLLGDDRVLRSAAQRSPAATAGRFQQVAADDLTLPGGLALATRAPVVATSLAEIAERFPSLAAVYDEERTLVVAPLQSAERQLGVLSMTFPSEGGDREAQVSFAASLADATTQAMERAFADERARTAAERLRFLAEASVALSGSLDVEATLSTVAALVVPRLADWCLIQLREGSRLVTAALAHVDPDKVRWAQAVSERYPTDPDAPTGPPNVIRTGRSELYNDLTDELLAAGARDAEHLEALRAVGMTSVLTVPLRGRTGAFGAITMISDDHGRRYDDDDVAFAEDLARRAALAVETVRAFEAQRGRLAAVTRISEAAQHAILAPPPSSVGALALAARYVSATAEAQVGGDLYEVVALPGVVRLLIGDVRGKGLEAVRNATLVLGEFRAAAGDRDGPDGGLLDLGRLAARIDERVAARLGAEDFVTALLAEVADDGRLTLASCGHPPPFVLSDGAVRTLALPAGLPLGLGASPDLVETRLAPGDRLLLHTDGLVETRDRDGRFVDPLPLVAHLAAGDLGAGLDRLLLDLRDRSAAELSDDLALLAVEYLGPTGSGQA